MAHLIASNNCLTAWRDVCSYILDNGDGFDILVEIEDPLSFQDQHLTEISGSGLISRVEISNVVNTIFPVRLYNRNPQIQPHQLYDRHEQLYLRGRTMHRKNITRWGNYFLRFTKFGAEKRNQLQAIIDGINNRANDQKACYIMHVSSVDYDNNTRIIGNPCLQYVQFGVYDNSLNLVAVYRNHDFLTKALGNYIGLSKLLEYVCHKTGSTMGKITCHSIHYYLNRRTQVRNCLNSLTW